MTEIFLWIVLAGSLAALVGVVVWLAIKRRASNVAALASMANVSPPPSPPSAAQAAADETVLHQRASPSAALPTGAGLPYLRAPSNAAGERFVLSFGTNTIGRDAANDVVLSDDGASRQHAEIVYVGGQFRVKDLNSTNHTLHKGERVSEVGIEIQPGDTLQFAATELLFSADGFELMDNDPTAAQQAMAQTLAARDDFIPALRTMAFLLERDVARKHEAAALWEKLKKLEKRRPR